MQAGKPSGPPSPPNTSPTLQPLAPQNTGAQGSKQADAVSRLLQTSSQVMTGPQLALLTN